jgi:hypothetical protein
VLSADIAPDRNALRNRLRYDYQALPMLHRKAVEDAAIDILANGQRMKESAVVVGERLLDVKQRLDHGQFSDWCTVEFDMSQRTAQNMMNVAKQFGGKSETVSLLSDSALYLLAAPSTPEPAREAVIEHARTTGVSPTKAEVKAVIDQHKPARTLPPLAMPAPIQPGSPEAKRLTREIKAGTWGDKLPTPAAPITVNGDRPLPGWVDAQPDEALTADDLSVLKPPPTAAADDRIGQAVRLIGIYRLAISTFDEYGGITGHHVETLPAKRELEKLIARLERESALLSGQPVEAWGEEVVA